MLCKKKKNKPLETPRSDETFTVRRMRNKDRRIILPLSIAFEKKNDSEWEISDGAEYISLEMAVLLVEQIQ